MLLSLGQCPYTVHDSLTSVLTACMSNPQLLQPAILAINGNGLCMPELLPVCVLTNKLCCSLTTTQGVACLHCMQCFNLIWGEHVKLFAQACAYVPGL